jgi:putative transposase
LRYQRHEQALVSTLAECYLQGVSTRKVREVVETLCGETVSASTVSRATKQLDATLAAWRARRLDAQPYPQLVIDAHYERIRREGQVLSTAVLWVMGVARMATGSTSASGSAPPSRARPGVGCSGSSTSADCTACSTS